LDNGMQLLDTPGILWPNIEDPEQGRHLAFCGSIRDEIMDMTDLGFELIKELLEVSPELLRARYRVSEETEGALPVMEEIARNRGFIMSGGRTDYERTARTVLDEFRSAAIGRISLERP
ncbi:MAG: ribosome biogenesis GTPase YlqF, partial [Firmicutes bacterium]|nr:ribosome biogenesis GTPase YlqF [Bacillota bacterium]